MFCHAVAPLARIVRASDRTSRFFPSSFGTSLKFPTFSQSPSPGCHVGLLEIDRLVDLLGAFHLDLVRRTYVLLLMLHCSTTLLLVDLLNVVHLDLVPRKYVLLLRLYCSTTLLLVDLLNVVHLDLVRRKHVLLLRLHCCTTLLVDKGNTIFFNDTASSSSRCVLCRALSRCCAVGTVCL